MKTIKKIAVATDFSTSSKTAYKYGLALAHLLKADFQLIHISKITEPEPEYKKLTTRLRRFANDKTVETAIFSGDTVQKLQSLASDNIFDLLILGTHGETGLFGHLFGGTAMTMVKKAVCPILLVPPKTHAPESIKNIAYATSNLSLDEHGITALCDWATELEAALHFLHVSRPGFNDKKVNVEPFMVGKNIPYQAKELAFISVRGGIEAYANTHPIDLVVAMTQHYSFLENLFHTSVTESLAWNSTLPLLFLHKE